MFIVTFNKTLLIVKNDLDIPSSSTSSLCFPNVYIQATALSCLCVQFKLLILPHFFSKLLSWANSYLFKLQFIITDII